MIKILFPPPIPSIAIQKRKKHIYDTIHPKKILLYEEFMLLYIKYYSSFRSERTVF